VQHGQLSQLTRVASLPGKNAFVLSQTYPLNVTPWCIVFRAQQVRIRRC
jgi:hypothetical protein